jgi:repressor LexA
MVPPPNEIERSILDYMESYLRRHTYQPSVREIGARFGIKSTKTVSEHLKSLAAKGYLERDPSRSRGARIVGLDLNAETLSVPCHSRIPHLRDDVEDEESAQSYAIDRRLAGAAGSFLVRVSGEDVDALGYEDGDLLLVQPVLAHEIRDGDVLAVHLTDEAGFYRYDQAGGLLHPGSLDAPRIPATRLEDLAVAGRVAAFLRSVGSGSRPDASGDAPPGRRWRRSSRRIADAREGRGRRDRRHR